MTIYAPVFAKDGNEFVIPYDGFWSSKDEEEATQIGIGSIVEAVMYGFTYTFNNLTVIDGKLPSVTCKLGGMDVYCVSGPIFESVKEATK